MRQMRRIARIALAVLVVAAAPIAGVPGAAGQSSEARARAEVGAKVNVNTADVKELMSLRGVGKRVAEKIVEYRKANGPFKRPEELRRVEGVGASLLERNRARIAVD